MPSGETKKLPLKGNPFRDETTGQNAPSQGFLIGPENRILEIVVQWILEGGPAKARLNVNTSNKTETGNVSDREIGVGPLWTPVTFYGPSGCGKSHLISGLYQAWKLQNRRKKAVLQSGADFARQYASALETRTIDDFRQVIRNAPFWAIDFLDDIISKQAAQEEFLHLLDDSTRMGNTIVLTSSRFPGELGFTIPQLTARLIGGLTVPIEMPGIKTRVAMLHEIAERFHVPWSGTTLSFLAKKLSLSYPGLFGVATRIIFGSELQVPDMETVRRYLKENENLTQPSLDEVLRQTAKHFTVKQKDIIGKSRSSTIARARAVAIYLSRQMTSKSLKQIGEFFGNRDHKTVSHHCEETEQKVIADPNLRGSVARIREMIQLRPKH